MNFSLLNYQLPGNKIAYAFSDAAGTNACIAMFELNRAVNREGMLFSNRSYFPKEYNGLVLNSIPAFKELNIDCVFTGTSHPESSDLFEVNIIKKAKSENVYTIAFIDHWINFELRFKGLSEQEMPDEIWVVDENAKILAEKEGLPSEILKVKGNPYHFFLGNCWKPTNQNKEYLTQIGIPEKDIHILFAPDPFSIRDIYKRTGFTEAEALKTVLEIVQQLKSAFLIVKLHPLQPLEILKDVLDCHSDVPYKLVTEANVPELLHASDVVIGFYSNLLLEAKALNKKVIRYFPGNEQADLLRMSNDLSKTCTTKAELKSQILSFIYE